MEIILAKPALGRRIAEEFAKAVENSPISNYKFCPTLHSGTDRVNVIFNNLLNCEELFGKDASEAASCHLETPFLRMTAHPLLIKKSLITRKEKLKEVFYFYFYLDELAPEGLYGKASIGFYREDLFRNAWQARGLHVDDILGYRELEEILSRIGGKLKAALDQDQ